LAALLAAAALAAYPAAQEIPLQSLAFGFGAGALALLALGLAARSSAALGWSIGALGAEYAVLFAAEGANLDRMTPVYAAGLFFVGEVAFWSIERRVPASSDPIVGELRLVGLVLTCVGAAGVAAVATVAGASAGGGGILLEALGVTAVIVSIVLLAALVRSSVHDRSTPLTNPKRLR
jgi:hypothetical protein